MDVFLRIVRGQTHIGEGFGNCRLAGLSDRRAVQQVKWLGDQALYFVAGIKAAVGILKDHLHFAPDLMVRRLARKNRLPV